MIKYFTIEGVPPNSIISAYRGTEEENTLNTPIPPAAEAITTRNILPIDNWDDF